MFLLALVALLSGRGMLSGTDVRVDGDRVIVQATSVPLTDVLSRFSQATGAKIVYDSAKPRQLVTVEIHAASQAEALAQLLEGQGLSYAVRLDPTGRSVDMLFLMGKGQPATASSSSPSPAPAPGRREVDRREGFNPAEEPPVEAEGMPEQQDPAEPFQDPLLDPAAAAPGVVGEPAPVPTSPTGGRTTPFAAPWQTSPPSFPQAASYPTWR